MGMDIKSILYKYYTIEKGPHVFPTVLLKVSIISLIQEHTSATAKNSNGLQVVVFHDYDPGNSP
jgi:hypothetical protein